MDSKIKQDFVDPQSFTDDKTELEAHRKVAFMKKIALELLEWVDNAIEDSQELTKIEKGEVKAVRI